MNPEIIIRQLRRMASDQVQAADETILCSPEMNTWANRDVRKRIAKASAFLDAIEAIQLTEKQGDNNAAHQDD